MEHPYTATKAQAPLFIQPSQFTFESSSGPGANTLSAEEHFKKNAFLRKRHRRVGEAISPFVFFFNRGQSDRNGLVDETKPSVLELDRDSWTRDPLLNGIGANDVNPAGSRPSNVIFLHVT